MPGVNVWHGCAKQSRIALPQYSTPPQNATPPPPTAPPYSPHADSAEVVALRKAVASLEVRCTALTARFDAIDSRIDNLVSQQATSASTLASLVESHQVVITSVTALTEKLDVVASRLERLGDLMPFLDSTSRVPGTRTLPGNARSHTSSSSAPRKAKGKLQ